MVTIKEIANRLGVSVSTVSKGINGASDISDSLRQQVLDTAIEMGYVSKKMKKEEHKKLCLFIKNMAYRTPDEFGYDIILGFKQAAFRKNWSIDIIPVTTEFQTLEKYDTYMLKSGYSGAFLVGFSLQDPWLEQLSNTSIPTVLFDNFIPKNANIGCIGTDSAEGIDLAVEYLYQLGHRKIAFLNGELHSLVSDQREQAYLDSMNIHHLETSPALMAHGAYAADSAKEHVPGFLDEGATAIICGNDVIAAGVIAECKKHGLQVPDDISVIGFDDLPVSSFLDPPLTTIRQNRLELGKCGYVTLESILNHVCISKTLMRPALIVRASTAPHSARATSS